VAANMRQVAHRTTEHPLLADTGKRPGSQCISVSVREQARLAESSIDILLWDFSLKSHFADAERAYPQAVNFGSTGACAADHSVDRSPAPFRFTAVFGLPSSGL